MKLFLLFSFFFFFLHTFTLKALNKTVSQVCRPLSSPVLAFNLHRAYWVQQYHCSSILRRVLRTHAVALSASQFVHQKKSQRFHTSSMHWGLELTTLTYTRLKDNLIRYRGDEYIIHRLSHEQTNAQQAVVYDEQNICFFWERSTR